MGYIKSYPDGRRILEVGSDTIRDYPSGIRLLSIDSSYISEYPSGRRIYEIEGYVPGYGILAFLMTN